MRVSAKSFLRTTPLRSPRGPQSHNPYGGVSRTISVSSGSHWYKQYSAAEIAARQKEQWERDGLRQFSRRVSVTSAGGIGVTALVAGSIVSVLESSSLFSDTATLACLGIGSLGSIISTFVLNSTKPKFAKDPNTGYIELMRARTPTRMVAFGALSASMGAVIAPLMSLVCSVDPDFLLISGGITASVVAALVYCSFKGWMPNREHFGPVLHIGLLGLIVSGIVSLFITGSARDLMFWSDTGAALCLFMAITATDTQRAIEAYKKGEPDHIAIAANFYLSFMQIFLRVVNVLMQLNQTKNKKEK